MFVREPGAVGTSDSVLILRKNDDGNRDIFDTEAESCVLISEMNRSIANLRVFAPLG